MKHRWGIYILVDLMKEFKKKCVDKGISASEQVQELIREWLKK